MFMYVYRCMLCLYDFFSFYLQMTLPKLIYKSVCICVCVLSHVQLFETLWTQPTRLLCPRDSAGRNTRVGCHFLLQGSDPTKGSNPHTSPVSPALTGRVVTTMPPGKPIICKRALLNWLKNRHL